MSEFLKENYAMLGLAVGLIGIVIGVISLIGETKKKKGK